MTILVLLVLSIALPSLDTFTDINLVIKLYKGSKFCDYNNWKRKNDTGDLYCNRTNDYLCDEYFQCYEAGPVSYCSNAENNQTVCAFATHYKMATAMLIPVLLNYFVCFITFLRKKRKEENIFAFIFALLNFYLQFG